MYLGRVTSSFSVSLSRLTALFKDWSKSTNVPSSQIVLLQFVTRNDFPGIFNEASEKTKRLLLQADQSAVFA